MPGRSRGPRQGLGQGGSAPSSVSVMVVVSLRACCCHRGLVLCACGIVWWLLLYVPACQPNCQPGHEAVEALLTCGLSRLMEAVRLVCLPLLVSGCCQALQRLNGMLGPCAISRGLAAAGVVFIVYSRCVAQ